MRNRQLAKLDLNLWKGRDQIGQLMATIRPVNVWLYAKCRRYIDPDEPEAPQIQDAEVEVSGEYEDDGPAGF